MNQPSTPADKIRAGLLACGRAGMQTPAMFALNAHVFGTHERDGIGLNAAVQALVGQLDPPDDPQHFSAPLACNILGGSAVTVFAVLADLRARGLLLGDRVVCAPLVPDHRVRDFLNLAARLPTGTTTR